MKITFTTILIFLLSNATIAQVGIGTTNPDPSSMLHISSGVLSNKGLLIPTLTLSATNVAAPAVAPANSLLIYNNATAGIAPNDVVPGFYYWDSILSKWQSLKGASGSTGWLTNGNSGIVDATHFIGTINNAPLNFRVNNLRSGRIESDPLRGSTFFGYETGVSLIGGGDFNTAFGYNALKLVTNSKGNTALGFNALGAHSTYKENCIGIGNNVQIAANNVKDAILIGFNGNITAANNEGSVVIGRNTLVNGNQTFSSIVIGDGANNNGNDNSFAIVIGKDANINTGTSPNSISIGTGANIRGAESIAIGNNAKTLGTNGNGKIAIGDNAEVNGNDADYTIAIGRNARVIGNNANNSMAIGSGAEVISGRTNSAAIGNGASVNADNTIFLGNTSVTNIRGQVNFAAFSDRRFKKEIMENVPGIEFIKKLRPVTYKYDLVEERKLLKVKSDKSEKTESEVTTGFIAQEVEQAAKETKFNFSGVQKPQHENDFYALRYAEFVVPIVKAMQEQQILIEKLSKKVEELELKLKK
jgi:trimeric autotransporter adhesin